MSSVPHSDFRIPRLRRPWWTKAQAHPSGVQPSGKLHLGNYFGAIQQHIALQDQGECFYFIADYHALTHRSRGRQT